MKQLQLTGCRWERRLYNKEENNHHPRYSLRIHGKVKLAGISGTETYQERWGYLSNALFPIYRKLPAAEQRGCRAAVPWSVLCRNVLWAKGKWHVSQLRISLHSSHQLAVEKADVKTPCVSLQKLLLTVIFRKMQPDSSQIPLILLTSVVYLTLSEPAW